jgi:multidrug resistance efflux pump
VDIHHIFPQDWCKKHGFKPKAFDSIINKLDDREEPAKRRVVRADLDIVAPVDGIARHRSAEIGGRISQGQQLIVLVQTAGVWTTANFKETHFARCTSASA